jgi:hypothetical protein
VGVLKMNDINTWQQGHFIDQEKYSDWSEERKDKAERDENCVVRPSPLGNKICFCNNPEDAKWIASRLNLASDLEQLTYDFVTEKKDETDLVNYVMDKINKG